MALIEMFQIMDLANASDSRYRYVVSYRPGHYDIPVQSNQSTRDTSNIMENVMKISRAEGNVRRTAPEVISIKSPS